MRAVTVLLGIVLLLCCAAAAMAAGEERYGYIEVEKVSISLDNDTAVINMDYTVDEGTRIIFFLLGRQDLKKRLYHILNYPDATMQRIDLTSAEFRVKGAAYSYGKGIYWYPSHEFNVVIPRLTVQSPQVTKTFAMTNQFPDGIGYFSVRRPEPGMPPGEVPA